MAASHLIHIQLAMLGGESLEFDMSAKSTIIELKTLVFERCEIPTACQRVIIDIDAAEDRATIASFCQEGVSSLSGRLILAMEEVLSQFAGGSQSRDEATTILCQLGQRGRAQAVLNQLSTELANAGGDGGDGFRYSAMHSFRKILESLATGLKDDLSRLHAFFEAALSDDDWLLRLAAVKSLGAVSKKVDRWAIDALAPCLNDADSDVCDAAKRELGKLMGTGSEAAPTPVSTW